MLKFLFIAESWKMFPNFHKNIKQLDDFWRIILNIYKEDSYFKLIVVHNIAALLYFRGEHKIDISKTLKNLTNPKLFFIFLRKWGSSGNSFLWQSMLCHIFVSFELNLYLTQNGHFFAMYWVNLQFCCWDALRSSWLATLFTRKGVGCFWDVWPLCFQLQVQKWHVLYMKGSGHVFFAEFQFQIWMLDPKSITWNINCTTIIIFFHVRRHNMFCYDLQ